MALRAAIFTDADLNAADLDDTRRNAAVLAVAVAELTERSDLERLEGEVALVLALLDGLVRLVVATDDGQERADLIDDFSSMAAGLVARSVGPHG